MRLLFPYLMLAVIPIIIVLFMSASIQPLKRAVSYPFAGKKLGGNLSFIDKYVPLFLRSLIFSGLIFCLARPQISSSSSIRKADGVDIMIAFDVSKSMLIEDYGKQSRINLAKKTVVDFVKGRKDDRIGFLMFSGESITLCPPTLDYEVLENAIQGASTNVLKDGTAIGDAIANSANRLKDSKAKSRIIVLLTDGDNNMGSIGPETAGALAKGYGIKVYAIALGKEGVVQFPTVRVHGRTTRYQRVNSTINPELLQRISKETGGRFFRAAQKGSLSKVFAEINKLEKTKVEKKERIRWSERYQYFLLGTLILLMLEFLLTRTRFRLLPN